MVRGMKEGAGEVAAAAAAGAATPLAAQQGLHARLLGSPRGVVKRGGSLQDAHTSRKQ
jgi:hypothetical protein